MDIGTFDSFPFDFESKRVTVYRRGSGPGVLVMHEIPGITPEMADFVDRLASAGFTVWMPHLFGEPGKPYSDIYALAEVAKLCIGREFSVFAANQSSPITNMLRVLGRKLLDEAGGKGIGAIGMCITGNFVLALMMDPFLLAPVLSQPSLPLATLVTPSAKRALHVSDAELENARKRSAGGTTVLGFRFTCDKTCPSERFARLREELGAGFDGTEIDSSPGNPHGIRAKAHSVFVREFRDEAGHLTRAALDHLINFYKDKLC